MKSRIQTVAMLLVAASLLASTSVATGASAGVQVTGVEDTSGDGVPEIAVHVGKTKGRILVFSGADGSLIRTHKASSRAARKVLQSAIDGQGTVAGDYVVGDIDGDDVAEVVAGSWDDGRLLVFSGGDASMMYALQKPGAAVATVASWWGPPCEERLKYVKSGGWRTLHWVWNAEATGYFTRPRDAKIKVRYGLGWFGWDSQKQKLDGFSEKTLKVTGASKVLARLQMRVPRSQWVAYRYCGY